MRILLDECLPRKLKVFFIGHQVMTVPEARWSGVKDTSLLRLAETRFDVFVTTDQNLQYQQNLGDTILIVVVLVAKNTMLETLHPLVPQVLDALMTANSGDMIHIHSS